MSVYASETITLGDLTIRSFCRPEDVRRFTFDEQFGVYAQYKSLYTKRASLARIAGDEDANLVLALSNGTRIVGFGVLQPPDPDERWASLGRGKVMEVKAIEVCRDRRHAGVAHGILKMMTAHPAIEEMIVYMVGYSWTWDLDGIGKSALEYRNILIALFSPFGFQELQTNEPNICLKPENLFMGRVGARISNELQQSFKWLRFGVMPAG